LINFDTLATLSIRAVRRLRVSAPLILASSLAFSQISEDDLRLPISLDAESTDYDGKNSMLTFKGLRLTQGSIGVQADEGRATKLDFEDSVWRFTGNVIIDTENGHIECDAADLRFENHQLQMASITGAPATFELQRPETTETTYAEARLLNYNFGTGVVEFSGNAIITEGGNQISSNYLIYNIAEQRINAQSAGVDGERVKIKYTPNTAQTEATPDASTDSEAGADPVSENESTPGADGDDGS
jgi:lipopolysaccharide transport protein LptA